MSMNANSESSRASHPLPTIAASITSRSRPMAEQNHTSQERNNVRNSLIAGSFSGILSTLGIYPMDVVRTKMQTGSGGPVQVLRHTLAHGGVRALYTGLSLPLAAQAVYKATVFTVNNATQNAIMDYRSGHSSLGQPYSLTLSDRFVCGFVGGAVNAGLFVTPVELVRNQLIAQHSKLVTAVVSPPTVAIATTAASVTTPPYFRGSWDVIRYIVQKQGPRSLWRGVSWSIARDGIGCGCFFFTIAWTQRTLTPVGDKPTFPVVLLSGGLAGLSYWVVSLPMDTVKTWIQSSQIEGVPLSTREAVRRIYADDGLVGLWQRLNRGWQVAYGRGIPSSAITIATYSFLYDHLQRMEVM